MIHMTLWPHAGILGRVPNMGQTACNHHDDLMLSGFQPPIFFRSHFVQWLQISGVTLTSLCSTHRQIDGLFKSLFKLTTKKSLMLHTTGLFVNGIHQWLVDSPHKEPVMRKVLLFPDIIMEWYYFDTSLNRWYVYPWIFESWCTRRAACMHRLLSCQSGASVLTHMRLLGISLH